MVTFAVSSVKRNVCEATPTDGQPISTLVEFAKEGCKDIVQASPSGPVVASESGFVRGVIEAYNNQHDLVLRPDDIWLAILIQFGLYVDGNAEELRSSLVKHEGKKELVIYDVGTLYTKLMTARPRMPSYALLFLLRATVSFKSEPFSLDSHVFEPQAWLVGVIRQPDGPKPKLNSFITRRSSSS